MNPFKFSPDDWDPYANADWVQRFVRWDRRWKWPADYRIFMGWAFALTIPTSLLNIACALLRPHSRTFLQNALVGPMFFSVMAAMNGIALWAIWKDKSWARRWAVAASSVFFLDFFKQFIIPLRPAWDHYISSLIAAVVGVVAFSWRDKQADAPNSNLTTS
jgi:hypothetical protein